MLDSGTLDVLNSIRHRNWLLEEDSNLSPDNEIYKRLRSELSELIQNDPVEIEYFTFQYVNGEGNRLPNIEVSIRVAGSLNVLFQFGSTKGIFINVQNYEMTDTTAESFRVLYVYYQTKFQQLCKTLIEG